MPLAQYNVPEEKVFKSVIGEIVLDLRPQTIENVFHLPWVDQYLQISYEGVDRLYRENEIEAKELVQSKYLIARTPLGQREEKVDMTHTHTHD